MFSSCEGIAVFKRRVVTNRVDVHPTSFGRLTRVDLPASCDRLGTMCIPLRPEAVCYLSRRSSVDARNAFLASAPYGSVCPPRHLVCSESCRPGFACPVALSMPDGPFAHAHHPIAYHITSHTEMAAAVANSHKAHSLRDVSGSFWKSSSRFQMLLIRIL